MFWAQARSVDRCPLSRLFEGKVDGSVNTNDLSIAATGQIKADVVYQSIATAKGAKVEGT